MGGKVGFIKSKVGGVLGHFKDLGICGGGESSKFSSRSLPASPWS